VFSVSFVYDNNITVKNEKKDTRC